MKPDKLLLEYWNNGIVPACRQTGNNGEVKEAKVKAEKFSTST
jgi:hypothetical protein